MADLFNKIEEIFRNIKAEPRTFRFRSSDELFVDMPKYEKNLYHRSSYEIKCNKPKVICEIRGDLVTKRELENTTKIDLEKLNCKITDIHRHPEEILYYPKEAEIPNQTSHLHFLCKSQNVDDTIRIVNFIKNF